ncbi:hypothetical protein ACLOJK_036888 [Asimina triloba]
MKSSLCIVFFLLTTATAIRLTSDERTNNADDAATNIIAGEQLAKVNDRKVLDGATNTSKNEAAAVSTKDELEDGEEGQRLIYNVDYHGVTTHPPKPKHPNPSP